jgi:protein tyrosine phosphatase (PTP) superfamily phosphohydrolase (DUF442 family)
VTYWERRFQRLQSRAERWDRLGLGLMDRAAAWLDMVAMDHGVLRAIYLNRHRIDVEAFRSAQPLPFQIHRMARLGVRTVVSLRGGRAFGSWPLERRACEAAGISLVQFPVQARQLPSRATLLALPQLFESIAYPALFHCKSGSDRTGLIAALYLLHRGRPLAEARRQLDLRFGHLTFTRAGILGALFDAYEREADGRSFLDWVRNGYDPQAIQRQFRAEGLWRWATGSRDSSRAPAVGAARKKADQQVATDRCLNSGRGSDQPDAGACRGDHYARR